MPEGIVLTSPVFQSDGVTRFRPWTIYLKRAHPDSPAEVRVVYRETDAARDFIPNGKEFTVTRSDTPPATAVDALIRQLNTADLSVKSLERRIVERDQADGKLGAGAIGGTP